MIVAAGLAGLGAPAATLDLPLIFSQTVGDRSRLVHLDVDRSLHPLSESFYSARDPQVSFDGKRLLFAGKRDQSARWQIYEMNGDGSDVRQIISAEMDCRHPIYQSTLYVLTSNEPWYQIAFVGTEPGGSSSLYSARLDGSEVRRITYNPYEDTDPFLMPDGRMLFASRQAHRWGPGERDRMPLVAVNIDGTDYAAFSGDQGRSWKRMPTVTSERLAVFVESESAEPGGGGSLAAIALRRNLHGYRTLTEPEEGDFHSPSPLPDGRLLVSFRSAGSSSYGIWWFDPATGDKELVYDDPLRDDLQAKLLLPRSEPDGRSSVVNEQDSTGILYCLNIRQSDLPRAEWLPADSHVRLRVLEGVAGGTRDAAGEPEPPMTRVLGEVAVDRDGSFNIRVPANIPIQLQLLDAEGMALRACRWIWVRNREPRGCIGCHEDGELTPENRVVEAVQRSPMDLTLPPERRRTVTYRNDVEPLVRRSCSSSACHGGGAQPRLTSFEDVRSQVRGPARVSPLVWSLYGRSTAYPWDAPATDRPRIHSMPPEGAPPLSDDARRTLIEWIDMGAQDE